MRLTRVLALATIAASATFVTACANRTGDQTIAEYCAADDGRADNDICKQHADIEGVRTSLTTRISETMGVAQHAQQTADRAMGRQMNCTTRTLYRKQVGSCESGAILTACTQTRYTTRAGGMSILRTISDTECSFNTRVLEMQVRCCTVGDPIMQTSDQQPSRRRAAAPTPSS